MFDELSVIAITYISHILFKDLKFVGNILYVIIAFACLKFFPDKTRLIVQATLAWSVFELSNAFLDLINYDEEDYRCTYTASTSKSGKTEEETQRPNSPEKISTSNSSLQPTEESTPLKDSTSVQPSTDVQ